MALGTLALLLGALPVLATPLARPEAATAAWVNGNLEAALAALEASPVSRERDLNRAVVLAYGGHIDEAGALLESIHSRDPRWTPALRWLARLRHELGHQESHQTAEALLASRDAEAQDALWAGNVFLRAGNAERAYASYASAVQREPGMSLGWLGLAQAEWVRGRPEAAMAAARRARGLNAEAGVPPTLLLFPGEELRYRVKYLFFRLAELRISTAELPGHPGAVRVLLAARSNPSIPFFHVDSTFESLLSADGRLLSHANLASDSDSGRSASRYEMDAAQGRCTVRWVREGLFGYDLLPLPPHPHDGVTVLLLLRALAQSQATVTVPTAVDGTWKPTLLRSHGRETLKWRGRQVDVVHVQSVGDYRGPGGLSGVVDVWVSADERAIPYKAKMKVAVGSVCLELLPPEEAP